MLSMKSSLFAIMLLPSAEMKPYRGKENGGGK